MKIKSLIAAAIALTAGAAQANVITNGNFSQGTTGWTLSGSGGGLNNFYLMPQQGMTSPYSGFLLPTLVGGGAFAAAYQAGAGYQVLTQDFTVSSGPAYLDFDMFVNTQTSVSIRDGNLGTSGQEFSRVDILSTTGAVLQNLYLGGSTPGSNWTHYSYDISSSVGAGGTFTLRFASANYIYFQEQGVDNVVINASVAPAATEVPEPGSLALAGAALLGLGLLRRSKR